MKMSDCEINEFQQASRTVFGIKVLLGIIEEHPSRINDDEVTAIASILKDAITPVADYLQDEMTRQGAG